MSPPSPLRDPRPLPASPSGAAALTDGRGTRLLPAILALALGSFAIGTTEFAIMGLLPEAVAELGVDLQAGGVLISMYALGVVVGAPVLAAGLAFGTAALLYLVLWRLSRGGLGFGDVRLAPVLGAAAAAVGWSTLLATLLLGSLVGAAVGVVLTLRGRPGSFAYAPSMLAGAFLACGLRALSG